MQITGRAGWLLGVVGAIGFIAFLALELSVEDGPLTFGKVALEAFEMLLIVGTAAVTALLFTQFRAHRDEQAVLVAELERARSQGQVWREKAQKHIAGLSAAIQEQFDQWGLSPAESEVAMLMLKGFSHKEIARLRNAGEQTVRQQARVVYAKADVSSRHAFCAFFLEDLLVPNEDDEDDEDDEVLPRFRLALGRHFEKAKLLLLVCQLISAKLSQSGSVEGGGHERRIRNQRKGQ